MAPDMMDWPLPLFLKRFETDPCPGCGRPTKVYVNRNERSSVSCRECGISTDHYDRMEDAVDAWNDLCRHQPSQENTP